MEPSPEMLVAERFGEKPSPGLNNGTEVNPPSAVQRNNWLPEEVATCPSTVEPSADKLVAEVEPSGEFKGMNSAASPVTTGTAAPRSIVESIFVFICSIPICEFFLLQNLLLSHLCLRPIKHRLRH